MPNVVSCSIVATAGSISRNDRLPAATRIGKARLAVSNLDQSVRFYRDVIGLSLRTRSAQNTPLAALGAGANGEVLLELEELPGVTPIHGMQRLGLYHTAFLLPSRDALSGFIVHLNRLGIPYGSSDHLVSEALYLTDPDGLTVEVYADRDRSTWSHDGGQIIAGSKPLNFAGIVPANSWQGAPHGTVLGHIHLYVDSLQKAADFYAAAIGFDIVNWSYPGALFVSAGGYHHHVGLNTWAARSPRASHKDPRLLFWELLLPDQEQVDAVSKRLSAAASDSDVTDKNAPSYADSCGIRVIISAESHRSHPTKR